MQDFCLSTQNSGKIVICWGSSLAPQQARKGSDTRACVLARRNNCGSTAFGSTPLRTFCSSTFEPDFQDWPLKACTTSCSGYEGWNTASPLWQSLGESSPTHAAEVPSNDAVGERLATKLGAAALSGLRSRVGLAVSHTMRGYVAQLGQGTIPNASAGARSASINFKIERGQDQSFMLSGLAQFALSGIAQATLLPADM